jgi:hypothetical protein
MDGTFLLIFRYLLRESAKKATQDHRWAVLRHAQDPLQQPSVQWAIGRSIHRSKVTHVILFTSFTD